MRTRIRPVLVLMLPLQAALFALGSLVMTAAPAAAQTPNSCGCYADPQGACICTKKSKCGCPDECEPVGCEEKRLRQANKDAELELKRIAAREKKKSAEAQKEVKEKRAREAKEARAARARTRKAEAKAKDEVDDLLK
jgi:hypothetical protein